MIETLNRDLRARIESREERNRDPLAAIYMCVLHMWWQLVGFSCLLVFADSLSILLGLSIASTFPNLNNAQTRVVKTSPESNHSFPHTLWKTFIGCPSPFFRTCAYRSNEEKDYDLARIYTETVCWSSVHGKLRWFHAIVSPCKRGSQSMRQTLASSMRCFKTKVFNLMAGLIMC